MNYQPSLFPRTFGAINLEQELPLAAMQESPASHVSQRYGHISSREIAEELSSLGFSLVSSKSEKKTFGKHVLNLMHPGIELIGDGVAHDRDLALEFAVSNSHDGSSVYRASLQIHDLESGLRFTLANHWSEVKIRHNCNVAKEAPEATLRLGDHARGVASL
jgi:hypothetical protein